MTATAGPNRAAMGTAATPSSSTDLPLPGVLTMGGPSPTPGDTTASPTTPGTTASTLLATDLSGTNRAGRGPTTTTPRRVRFDEFDDWGALRGVAPRRRERPRRTLRRRGQLRRIAGGQGRRRRDVQRGGRTPRCRGRQAQWGGGARWALDCRPPHRGHGKSKKTNKQQSTGRRQRVGAAEGSQRVAEVTPFALLFILLGQWLRVALDCHTTLGAPKNNKKTLKQQSTNG